MLKSILLGLILATSGAQARKYSNRLFWSPFCKLLEPGPESTQIYNCGPHFIDFWSQARKCANPLVFDIVTCISALLLRVFDFLEPGRVILLCVFNILISRNVIFRRVFDIVVSRNVIPRSVYDILYLSAFISLCF